MVNPLIPKRGNNSQKFIDLPHSAGILDDFAVRKAVATKEGTITKTPINNNDIVNKKYVDDTITALGTNYAKLDGTNHPFSYVKTPKIYPNADSTTAIQILKANGTTSILNVDTTNSRVGILTTPSASFHVNGAEIVDGGLTQRFTYMLATPAIGIDIQSNAIASLANPVKMSPSLSFRGQAWNTTVTAASKLNCMVMYMKPVSGTTTSGKITFANNTIDGTANTTELMSITSAGKVGIGTTSPDLSAGSAIALTIENSNGARLELSRKSDSITDGQQIGSIDFFAGSTTQTGVATIRVLQVGTTEDAASLDFRTIASGGSISSRMNLSDTGDLVFLGSGTGLPYGSCYGNEIGWTQASAVQNTEYLISDADIADGELNLATHDGSGKLTLTKAGRYLINWGIDVESSVVNQHIVCGIAVSGTGTNAGQSHVEPKFANEEESTGSTAILSLSANATIELFVKCTDAGTPNISVSHMNLTAVMVGG